MDGVGCSNVVGSRWQPFSNAAVGRWKRWDGNVSASLHCQGRDRCVLHEGRRLLQLHTPVPAVCPRAFRVVHACAATPSGGGPAAGKARPPYTCLPSSVPLSMVGKGLVMERVIASQGNQPAHWEVGGASALRKHGMGSTRTFGDHRWGSRYSLADGTGRPVESGVWEARIADRRGIAHSCAQSWAKDCWGRRRQQAGTEKDTNERGGNCEDMWSEQWEKMRIGAL